MSFWLLTNLRLLRSAITGDQTSSYSLMGCRLVLIELKNPADENATISSAFKQFGTYQKEIPSIFRYNEVLVISDGTYAKAGTMTAKEERFSPLENYQRPKNTQDPATN